MPRRNRADAPDAWRHIFNRGIARRPMFENLGDVRYFLACLAWCVREGLIELHAYSILTTHFHLLVRSLVGRLCDAMQWSQSLTSRRFNRLRRRDGPLVRGRFGAREIRSALHLEAVVRYIDANPVDAKIVASAADYPHGSARFYVHEAPPIWLTTDVVRGILDDYGVRDRAGHDAFVDAMPRRAVEHIVVGRSRCAPSPDALDDLVGSAPAAVRAWMERKARLADGTSAGEPLLVADALVDAARVVSEALARPADGRRAEVAAVALAGMLRWFSGATLREIALRTGCGISAADRRVRLHAARVAEDPSYADAVSQAIHDAARREFPPRTAARLVRRLQEAR